MDILLEILASLALVAFVILTIYAMVSLRALVRVMNDSRNSLAQITSDISQLKDKLVVSLDNIDKATLDMEGTINRLENHVNTILGSVDPFVKLSQYVYQKVAPPITTSALLISGISKAVTTFVNLLSKSKN